MNTHSGIAIQSRDGRTIGVIEFKRNPGITAETAASICAEHVGAGNLRGVRFFLLVTPAAVFLWDLEGNKPAHEIAAYESAPPKFLQERMTEPLDEHIMLLATYEWLVHLAYQEPDLGDPAEKALSEAGFIPALHDAQFRFEPAA
jgi:hypothetical protein